MLLLLKLIIYRGLIIIHLLIVRSVVGSIPHELVPASIPQLVNKGHGMCYPVFGMVHVKDLMLLIRNIVAAAAPLSHYLNDPNHKSFECVVK